MRTNFFKNLSASIVGGLLLCAPSAAVPTFSRVDITSDRFGAMPLDTLQIVALYDGDEVADLTIQLRDTQSTACFYITVRVYPFGSQPGIRTEEWNLDGYLPTGRVTIANVQANGVIDGVAFGLQWRDVAGDRTLLRSRKAPANNSGTPDFVGGWPLAFSQAQYDAMLDDISNSTNYPSAFDQFVAQRQAQMIISGAQLLDNGVWGTPTVNPFGIPDLNGDGCVDLIDLSTMLSWFGGCLC